MTSEALHLNPSGHLPACTAKLHESSAERSRMLRSRLIGGLFLVGFLTYGVGFGLVSSLTTIPVFSTAWPAHQTTLVVGALLMLLNTASILAKAVLFFPSSSAMAKASRLPISPP